MSIDQILIQGLRLRCEIGFSPHELGKKQDVLINLTFFTDLRRAGQSDDPQDVLDYRTVNKAIIAHVEASHYKTVEALAENIARLAIVEHAVPHVRVEVYKPHALRFSDNVGVMIERQAADYA
jgi:FolB domain-containing protein